MEAKHTPGPWTYEKDMPNGYHHAVRALFAGGHVIGQVYGGEGGRVDNSDANARLIAAAPDLLDALRATYSDIQRLPGYTIDMLGRIEAAIARATA